MDIPSQELAHALTDPCPKCAALVKPVAVATPQKYSATAAYRCHLCRHDFLIEWQSGYVKTNPTLSDIMPPVTPNTPTAPTTTHDPRCGSCGAPPGAPHAMACPYN